MEESQRIANYIKEHLASSHQYDIWGVNNGEEALLLQTVDGGQVHLMRISTMVKNKNYTLTLYETERRDELFGVIEKNIRKTGYRRKFGPINFGSTSVYILEAVKSKSA